MIENRINPVSWTNSGAEETAACLGISQAMTRVTSARGAREIDVSFEDAFLPLPARAAAALLPGCWPGSKLCGQAMPDCLHHPSKGDLPCLF